MTIEWARFKSNKLKHLVALERRYWWKSFENLCFNMINWEHHHCTDEGLHFTAWSISKIAKNEKKIQTNKKIALENENPK